MKRRAPKLRTRDRALRRLARVPFRDLVENVRNVYACATAEERAHGLEWYAHAHATAADIASRVGCTVPQAAGVLAALSPSTSWETNVSDAYRVASGERRGITAYGANVRKVARILESYGDPLEILGGPKVRAFYACILDPHGDHATVCVDRHAVAIAFGRRFSDTTAEGARYLALAGAYARIARAYTVAARQLGILPHQLQAVTWVAWRNLVAAGRIPAPTAV